MSQTHLDILGRAFLSYANIPQSELEYVAQRCAPLNLPEGAFFVQAGDAADRFGYVLSGTLRKFYTLEDGREFTRAFVGGGDWAGCYASILEGTPATMTVQAVTEAQLVVLPVELIHALYDRHPAWDRVGRKIAEKEFIERERREYELLCESASQRYVRLRRERPELLASVHQYLLASYLGVTPVSLSRIRASLRDQPIEG